MAISVFELFRIGIGPSSSHTVGPMRAARQFAVGLEADGLLERVASVRAHLYGSLGATGKGHGSDKAVLLGLEGDEPDRVDPATIPARIEKIRGERALSLLGRHRVAFDESASLVFHRRESLPFHPNGMTFAALDASGATLREKTYYSVGGGFVVDESATGADRVKPDPTPLPYPFSTGAELLAQCEKHGLSISALMLENEKAWRPEAEVRAKLLAIWEAMQECVRRGCQEEGTLPGGMKVRRRAAELYRKLSGAPEAGLRDPLTALDWVNLYALAVNEENAAGGRVVTAPTNGAAGIIPAVLHYYARFVPGADDDGVVRFLLTAGALAEVQGGTPAHVENAAEIGMEHNLGLTCDPVGGLVQVPCIERNAMGSVKAINAARIALRGDGKHFVSLDEVIKTMRETGRDMSTKYKETSRGGLAVNVIEC